MKKITLLITLMVISFGYAQQQTYNVTFQTGSTIGTWSTFEDGSNPALEIIANPVPSGINTSATVAKFTSMSTANGGQPWAGTQTDHGALGEWLLETGNNTISIMVYKTVISDVGIKFVNSTNGTVFDLKQANTVINTWETLTYDISSAITSAENHNIDRLVIYPDWPSTRTQDNVTYFDNVTWSANKTAAPPVTVIDPTVAATTPTENAANVISVYSDAYTNITGVTLNPGWGQTTIATQINIGGNNTLKYANLNYQGTDFFGNAQNVSGMTHLHFDYYTTDATALQFYLINASTGGGGEKFYDVAAQDGITLNSWVSKNIPLTYFTNLGFSLADVMQFKVVGNGTIYFDNFYFVNNASLATGKFDLSQFSIYPNPSSENWNIKSKTNINSIQIYDVLGKQVIALKPNSKKVSIKSTALVNGMYFAKIKSDKGLSSIKLFKD